MDEIKGTQPNSPQAGKASDGSQETTPKVDTKTYTQEELDRALQADRIARGRDAKSFELREKSLNERDEALKRREAEIEAADLEKLKDNPEALDLHKQSRAIKEERAALEKDKREHEATIRAAQEELRDKAIWGIAAGHTTDPKEMANLHSRLKNLNIDDMAKLEEIAAAITAEKPKEPTENKDGFAPDSGVTSGTHPTLKGDRALSDYFRNK